MSSKLDQLRQQYAGRLASMLSALESGEEEAFVQELDDLVQARENSLTKQLRKLTVDLSAALERFQLDSRLVDLTEKEVPDARHRLDHVMKLTDEAAHKTLDLVEQSGPLAERTAREALAISTLWSSFRGRKIAIEDFKTMLVRMDQFLKSAQADSEKVRENLAEVLMTQGYQDLTGQIIRGVIKLVGEIEGVLNTLLSMSTETGKQVEKEGDNVARGFGPAIPGINQGVVVGGQQDVDALLSGLGM
jgi:chemotaxis protein CheZ